MLQAGPWAGQFQDGDAGQELQETGPCTAVGGLQQVSVYCPGSVGFAVCLEAFWMGRLKKEMESSLVNRLCKSVTCRWSLANKCCDSVCFIG